MGYADFKRGADVFGALTGARVLRNVNPRMFGIKFDGTDESAKLITAFAQTAGNGELLEFPPYSRLTCASPPTLAAGLRVKANGSTLVRMCATTGQGGFIAGPTLTKTNDIIIDGLNIESPDTTTYAGNIFAIYGDDVKLLNCSINRYGSTNGGRAVFWRGDRGEVIRLRAITPRQDGGSGGIRVAAGSDFLARGCYVESGDDTYQFVPGVGDNQSIYRGAFVQCRGISFAARLMVASLIDPASGNTTADFTQPAVGATVTVNKTTDNRIVAGDTIWVEGGGYYNCTAVNTNQQIVLNNTGGLANSAPGTVIVSGARVLIGSDAGSSGGMTASIQDVSFIDVKGTASGLNSTAFAVRNGDSTGGIDGVTVTDCAVNLAGSQKPNAITITGKQSGAYPCDNIKIDGLRIRNPYQVVLRVLASDTYGAVTGLHIRNFIADKAVNAGQEAIQFYGVADGSISASSIYCNGANGILLGSSDNSAVNFAVDNVTVRDIGNGFTGVRHVYAAGCTTTNLHPYRLAGATTSTGIGVAAGTASGAKLGQNDYTHVDTGLSGAVEGSSSTDFGVCQGIGAVQGTLSIGRGRTGDGASLLDFMSDGTVTSTVKTARVTRNAGVNGNWIFDLSQGTGSMLFQFGGVTSFGLKAGGVFSATGGTLATMLALTPASGDTYHTTDTCYVDGVLTGAGNDWIYDGSQWRPRGIQRIAAHTTLVTGAQQTAEQVLKTLTFPIGIFAKQRWRVKWAQGKTGTTDVGSGAILRFGTAGTTADAALCTSSATILAAAKRSIGCSLSFESTSATVVRRRGSAGQSDNGDFISGSSSVALQDPHTVANMTSNAMMLSVTATMATAATDSPVAAEVYVELEP